jgi:hypothetical protein
MAMTDREIQALDAYLAGVLEMLRECQTGANVHEIANLRTSITTARQYVERYGKTEQASYVRTRANLASAIERSRALYRTWISTRPVPDVPELELSRDGQKLQAEMERQRRRVQGEIERAFSVPAELLGYKP